MDEYQVQWREPSKQIAERVMTYCSTYADYPNGFGYYNPHHTENSGKLQCMLGLKHVQWLRQTHSNDVCRAPTSHFVSADASWTRRAYHGCAVMTADCLPVFFSNDDASQVAAVHAGWRGLAAGILQRTLAAFKQADKVHTAFGPAICQEHYEVGEELLQHFPNNRSAFRPANFSAPAKGLSSTDDPNPHKITSTRSSQATAQYGLLGSSSASKPHKQQGKYYLSLYDLASQLLTQHKNIVPPLIPDWCTYKDADNLPSHRRDPAKQQRIANLIWLV